MCFNGRNFITIFNSKTAGWQDHVYLCKVCRHYWNRTVHSYRLVIPFRYLVYCILIFFMLKILKYILSFDIVFRNTSKNDVQILNRATCKLMMHKKSTCNDIFYSSMAFVFLYDFPCAFQLCPYSNSFIL